ncbi:hypothetical protein ACF1FY_34365 [Streptomyces althioticus]|uniref:hypothetical protein n=1 Tax=Streptomyces althioticus TaxID=83380 RepID=UPI0036FF01E1
MAASLGALLLEPLAQGEAVVLDCGRYVEVAVFGGVRVGEGEFALLCPVFGVGVWVGGLGAVGGADVGEEVLLCWCQLVVVRQLGVEPTACVGWE